MFHAWQDGSDTGRTTPPAAAADSPTDSPAPAHAHADACPAPVLVVGAAGGPYLRLGRGAVVGTDVLPSLLRYTSPCPAPCLVSYLALA